MRTPSQRVKRLYKKLEKEDFSASELSFFVAAVNQTMIDTSRGVLNTLLWEHSKAMEDRREKFRQQMIDDMYLLKKVNALYTAKAFPGKTRRPNRAK